MNVELWMWLAVCAGIVVMLLVDLFAHRNAHEISLREAALWSAFWVTTGVGFGVLIWNAFGEEYGQQYFAGFVIEKSLAIDNVFIWALIFAAFSVQENTNTAFSSWAYSAHSSSEESLSPWVLSSWKTLRGCCTSSQRSSSTPVSTCSSSATSTRTPLKAVSISGSQVESPPFRSTTVSDCLSA